MADRTIKPDDGNDLVLQNNDGSAKVEVNEAQTVVLTGGSTTGVTVDTSGNAEFPVSVKTDTISEKTAATGVTIDGTLIKDNSIKPASGQSLVLKEDDGNAVLTIDTSGVITMSGNVSFNESNLTNVGEIYCDKIYGDADTNTYIEWSGSDRWKVFCGGAVKLDVNDGSGGIGIAGAADGLNYTVKAHGSLYASSLHEGSDRRIKKDIVDSDINACDLLNKVRVRNFYWNDPTEQDFNNRNARGVSTGFIAQELVDHIPSMVLAPRKEKTLEIDRDSETLWSINYSAIIGILVKSIQELSIKVTALETN